MGYDLVPRNRKLGGFYIGSFSFPILLEAAGYLYPCIQGPSGQWYCLFGADKRMPKGDTYPRLISNDGFRVTAEEARVLARVARNYVAIQRSLPEQEQQPFDMPAYLKHWPQKIRTDFVDKFEQFAAWADKSQGFAIH
jgi:hypothetical protein